MGIFDKIKNAFSGATRKLGNTAGYLGRAANRTGARLSGYKSLTNKYNAALKRAGANKARVESGLMGRSEGESLNEYRKRLATARMKGWSNWRQGIKSRVTGTAKAISNRFRAGLGKAKKVGQNVLAWKLGRGNEEREANWANYYGKKANSAQGSLAWALKADREALDREEARKRMIGYLAESIMGVGASAAGAIAVLRAYMKMPSLGEGISLDALKALIAEIEAGGKNLTEDMKVLLGKLGLALDEEAGKVSDAVLAALKQLKMSEERKKALAKAFADLRAAMAAGGAKGSAALAAVGAALASIPGMAKGAAASFGAAFVAMKNMDLGLRKRICGDVGACAGKNNGPNETNKSARNRVIASQKAAQPAANQLKAWASTLKSTRRSRR